MGDSFAQGTTPIGVLRGILGSIPFSVGFLREILQNSNDAGASRQIFVLDRRSHRSASLVHPNLAATQGPALLAFNDAGFNAADWHALQSVYESSKTDDSSKIGKYGVGFRSVFHITDCPQIVSGDTFAMFDPLQEFTGSAGIRLKLAHVSTNHPDQLSSFSHFLDPAVHQSQFNGTIIRCPLRRTPSRIDAKVVDPSEIANLFREFIFEEIDIELLFLQHIQSIHIYEINENDGGNCLAEVTISRSPRSLHGSITEAYLATVSISIDGDKEERRWQVVQCLFNQEEAIQILSQESSDLTSRILKDHKLLPTIGLAMPLSDAMDDKSGRLFTFLPLPLPTGFPVHIHAYFALTQSRQNLRNSRETGLGRGDLILVKWNELLFDRYIPQAWKVLLEILAENGSIRNIFMAWPPEQRSPATSGENVYWKFLPGNTLNFTVLAKSSIWPVYQIGHSKASLPEFRSLDVLIAADQTISSNVLDALTAVGLQLAQPPQYIVDLIRISTHENIRLLTPSQAHQALLNHITELHDAPDDVIQTILGYLLSTTNVHNIVGLPLIELVSGRRIPLSKMEDTTTWFTLLNLEEFNVFKLCDDDAIPLHRLPAGIAETLRSRGPGVINVESLTVHRIVDYLEIYPSKLNLDLSSLKTDPGARRWLSAFWIWQNKYPYRQELFASIRHLFLLPSSKGLRKADSSIFRSRGTHPATVKHFESLGIPFLDAEFPEPVQNVLTNYGLLKTISDIHKLLDTLSSPFDGLNLSKDACMAILAHISASIPGSCSLYGPLADQHIQCLRSLPIFPIVQANQTNSYTLPTLCAPIPPSSIVRVVGARTFLPSIPNYTFIQFPPSISPSIMDYIEASYPKHLSDIDLLSLTVNHFVDQPDHVHAAALKFMAQNLQQIPPHIIASVKRTSFVAVQDGSRKLPIEVVDPLSPIYRLYADNTSRRVRQSSPSDEAVIQALRSLKLMAHTLTIEVVQETIETISSNSQSPSRKWLELAKYLLSLMIKANLDYSQLKLSPDQQWLPTDQGLRGFDQCRDHDPAITSRRLFDKVLAVLEPSKLPSSLKHALGWDQPLSMHILIDQLDQTLSFGESDVFSVVFDILQEIGSRTLSEEELTPLRSITRDRKWVPTIDRQLSETANAVFSQPLADSGFSQICHIDQKTRNFLRCMGCEDRPSPVAIIARLQALSNQPPSLSVVNTALNLLRSLPPDLTNDERPQVLVPDVHNILRPFSETFFNDIGDQVQLVPNNDGHISHPLIDENLAQTLALGRLGLKYTDLIVPGVDMGEKPVITVRKTLSQYAERQFVTEFLANAADANAAEFTLLVNKFCGDTTTEIHALSPVMAKFCTSPSLVVHNDAMFSDEDFVGICRTSVGGKQNRRETIGHFGLGALTMFHFTELAIVVSNDRVLFLNPSKSHLPIRDSAALMLHLNHVRKFYRSHLATLDGLFGFDLSSDDPYNGTIFLLPLREDRHLEVPECISRTNTWTPKDIERNIVSSFSKTAANSLLFTRMRRLEGCIRNSDGVMSPIWSFEAVRTAYHVPHSPEYSACDVDITDQSTAISTWIVVTATVQEADIPEDLHTLATETHLRLPPVAGLALCLDSESPREKYKFFSILPLAIENSLPVHVMASFILASDRRQIRMDDYAGPETRYNKWLLSEIIPPLYYFLLELMVKFGDPEQNYGEWWPRHHTNDDSYSRSIVDSFYSDSRLKHSHRRVLRALYHPAGSDEPSLTPDEAILLSGREPESVQRAISRLEPRNVVKLPAAVYRLATEKARIETITPAFLREEIVKNPLPIVQSELEIIRDIIIYLSSSDSARSRSPSNVFGLPILPLDDGGFGVFSDPSSSTQFYLWMSTTVNHNFPSRYFVHSQLRVPDLIKLGVNVMPLNSAVIRRFVEETLANLSSANDVPPETSSWVLTFWNAWEEYAKLGLHPQDIAEFPLVPTINPTVFVSLNQCMDGTALLVGGSNEADEMLRAALHRLGLTVVRLDEEPTPENLRYILRHEEYQTLNFENVLTALASLEDLDEKLLDLDDDLLAQFSSWARRNIKDQAIPNNILPIARQLPIWRSMKSGSPEKHRSAAEVYMLPDGLKVVNAGPFMRVLVANYGKLRFLGASALSFEQVGNMLELPRTMGDSDLRLYTGFLRVWIPGLPHTHTQPIPIPNANRVVTPSNELYARTPLFTGVFGDDSDRFIARELREIEHILYRHGLRYDEQLDAATFRICADAVLSRQDDQQILRAGILFEAYCFTLPMHVHPNDQQIWFDLDQISFIPRNMSTERRLDAQDERQAGLPIPNSIVDLPAIVSPSNLVRKEFEAVAWSQRALFDTQPHQRVQLAHPSIGLPDVSVVIRHLKVLASLSINASRQQRNIILHDLKETYAFLTNIASILTSEEIDQLSDDSIFLNVDDPDVEAWHWDDRDHLVFEMQDMEGSFRHVRDFLKPFDSLLRHVGVLEVHHPQYQSDHSTNSDALKLDAIRKGFDTLRKENSLTDVVFIPSNSEPDSDSLVAHRAFLAVVSDYFKDMFCGEFQESRAASPQDPVRLPVENSALCIQAILDYIYTGVQSKDADAPLDLLLKILHLSGYWRIADLFEDIQREVVDRRLINPSTLDTIRTMAQNCDAQNLLRNCIQYEARNTLFIQKVRQSAEFSESSEEEDEGDSNEDEESEGQASV